MPITAPFPPAAPTRSRHLPRPRGAARWLLAALGVPLTVTAAWAADGACSARSGATVPVVVELYTSEGCNSCPPADRWLHTLVGRDDVLPLAFHVDYWDRLGWKDRFSSSRWTQRQTDSIATSGARFSYTPQVLVNGREDRRWPDLPATEPSTVAVALARDGSGYVATVSPGAGAPAALAGYWAVTEDGHRTQVRAGENAGAALAHDAVVRDLLAVPAVVAGMPLRFTPSAAADPVSGPKPRRVVFVVTDAKTGRPVQAVSAGC